MTGYTKMIATIYHPAQSNLPYLAVVLADGAPVFVAPAPSLDEARNHLHLFFAAAEQRARAMPSARPEGTH